MLLDFKDIQLSDRDWVNALLKKSDFMGCEYSFANNMAWKRLGNSIICRYKDFYISKFFTPDNKPVFTFPAGEGDYSELIDVLYKHCKDMGETLVFYSANKTMLEIINKLIPERISIQPDESSFDYIYYTKDLIELKGKKYHQKRNHLARFYQNNWSYEPINSDNVDECIEFSVLSYNGKQLYDDESSVKEQYAINTFFNNFDKMHLKGGVIRVDGKVVAFTIGEQINSNTFCVHIEKADANIQGAYTAINNEFLKYNAEGCLYTNREEDMGLDGLRKAKRSYYPCFLLEKWVISVK